MPLAEMPKYNSVPDKRLDIPAPAIGGLNLDKMEYELPVTQSPYMKNIMYDNGVLQKRYGITKYSNAVYPSGTLDIFKLMIDGVEEVIVNSNNHLYIGEDMFDLGVLANMQNATIFNFNKQIYFYYSYTSGGQDWYGFKTIREATDAEKTSSSAIYKGFILADVDTYIPTVMINCKPDGSYSDVYEDFNLIGDKFKIVYHSDGTSKTYKLPLDKDIVLKNKSYTTVEVDGEVVTNWDFNNDKDIVFTTAPAEGDSNVTITLYGSGGIEGSYSKRLFFKEKLQLANCSSYALYGGTGSARLFLAGGGDAKVYWSDAYDCTYFPENNWMVLGNPEYDVNGLGVMYNVLFALKKDEVHSISGYTINSSNSLIEEDFGLEGFKPQIVNKVIGCDAPKSIQIIDNRLTWFNSKYGVCTLASTNIIDERNVQVISKNVAGHNAFVDKGILDFDEKPVSADYDYKYWLIFPTAQVAFVWDYKITPYVSTSSKQTNPEQLSWFMFDRMNIKQMIEINNRAVISGRYSNVMLFELDKNSLTDIYVRKVNDEWVEDVQPINAIYMTPFLDFGMTDYLKTVRNMYVQVRADRPTKINIKYYTDEVSWDNPEIEPEPIEVGSRLWSSFQWSSFKWRKINWATTFRRKCSLKKIQMASFYFDNNELGKDMNISDIVLTYQFVKVVK